MHNIIPNYAKYVGSVSNAACGYSGNVDQSPFIHMENNTNLWIGFSCKNLVIISY